MGLRLWFTKSWQDTWKAKNGCCFTQVWHCKMLGRKMGLRVRWPGLECELAHCHVSLDKSLGKPEYLNFLLCEMWDVNNENLFPNV